MKILSCISSVLLFAAVAAGQSADGCTGLVKAQPSNLPNPSIVFMSTTLNAPRPPQGNVPALPEHCEVLGKINGRIGVNGQRYAIKFHLRLPTAWNGKFFFEGGVCSNGNLGTAFGNLQGQQRTNALTLGYAVVRQDAGHDNAINNDPERN